MPASQGKIIVDACVDSSGSGGAGQKGDRWTLRVTLAAWIAEGELHRERLLLRQTDLRRPELHAAMNQLDALALVRLRLRAPPTPATDPPGARFFEGELIEVLGPSDDPRLAEIVEELQRPVMIEDPELGAFTLDRRLSWFRGATRLDGGEVRLQVSTGDVEEATALLAALRRFVAEWEAQRPPIEACILAELLDLKNDSWSDPGEEVTAAQFLAAITLESIVVYDDGNYELYLDDGGLFAGHVILVSGSLEGGPTDATIAG